MTRSEAVEKLANAFPNQTIKVGVETWKLSKHTTKTTYDVAIIPHPTDPSQKCFRSERKTIEHAVEDALRLIEAEAATDVIDAHFAE